VRLVIDASVMVQVLLADRGLGPLTSYQLVAPALLLSEATSVLRELAWRAEMPQASAIAAVARMLELPVAYEPAGSLALEATAIAAARGWAKTYDAEYLALAARLDCPLVTLDERLHRGAGPDVDVRRTTDL
jgi:predicted nucleic acid-binding protein